MVSSKNIQNVYLPTLYLPTSHWIVLLALGSFFSLLFNFLHPLPLFLNRTWKFILFLPYPLLWADLPNFNAFTKEGTRKEKSVGFRILCSVTARRSMRSTSETQLRFSNRNHKRPIDTEVFWGCKGNKLLFHKIIYDIGGSALHKTKNEVEESITSFLIFILVTNKINQWHITLAFRYNKDRSNVRSI